MKQELFKILGDILAWTALFFIALSTLGIAAVGIIQGVYMVRHIKRLIRTEDRRVR